MKIQAPPPDPAEDRLLGFPELGKRWSCHPQVAWKRAHQLGVPVIRFNSRAHAVRLSDILRIEALLLVDENSKPVTSEGK